MSGPTTSAGNAADRLRRIESLTDAKLANLGVEEMLSELLDRTLEVLSAETAAVLLLDPSGEQLVATAARGLEAEVYQGVRVPLGRGFAGRVAARKSPVVIDDIDNADVVNPLLRETGLRSMLGVPLLVSGRVLGVLHVGSRSAHRFSESDVELLQMVADRVALATHGILSEGERKAGRTLQRSLLPDRLPEIAGLEAAIRYSAGGEGDVGGDWYDVFVLPSRWVCITVGDVVGRGLHAAVIMGRARATVRAFALTSRPDPAAILQQVDDTIQHFEPAEMATAVLACIDPSLSRMSVSLAGHPPPLLACEGREAAYLDVPVDPPLGVAPSRNRRVATHDLHPGSVVAFYTDGLVERRKVPIGERLEALRRLVRAEPPEDVCIKVMGALVGREPPADDVALLVLRRSAAVAASPLEMTVPAVASNLGEVRAGMRRWLTEVGADQVDQVDLLLAMGEATSNAVEHAYGPGGGDMTVRAELDDDTAVITVSDRGRWRAPRGSNRGRGSHLMASVTDDVTVERRVDGTDVVLRRRLRRGAPA